MRKVKGRVSYGAKEERKPEDLLFSVTAKDCRRDVFAAGGKGGQHQNKTSSGVRWTHIASGAVGESREERSQLLNSHKAWRRMAESEKFRRWQKIETSRRRGVEAEIERNVERSMMPKNLRVEVKDDAGRWVPEEAGSGS